MTTLSISNIERAETWPKAETIDALAAALEKRPFELFLDETYDKVISKADFNNEINLLIKELYHYKQKVEDAPAALPEDFSIAHSQR